MKILIATQPFAGHFNPTQPVAKELVRHGHDVVWMTGPSYESRVTEVGARFVRMSDEAMINNDEMEPDPGTSGLAKIVSMLRKLFLDRVPAQVEDYQQLLETFPADILLVEFATYGAHALHDLTGMPYATLGINPLVTLDPEIPPWGTGWQPPKTVFRRLLNIAMHRAADWFFYSKMTAILNSKRAELGLGPLPPGESFATVVRSPILHLQMSTPAFEFPRQNLSRSVKFVGPLLPLFDEATFQPPDWWDTLLSHPRENVIHVTQGTVATQPENLLKPAVQALSPRPDLLLVITGKDIDNLLFPNTPKPSNVLTSPFVPHARLLPHVGVMVTNGGYNGVLAALSAGVPLVCAGTTEDKADVCSRVAWSGAGVDLRTDAPSERALADAVEEVMGDDRYRAAAERVRDDFARHDGPVEVADELERVVGERRARVVAGTA
ncbi:Glycosyl transferase (PdmS protein) [Coniochaeta hoffmannii]|uniref:Glycosyl transferase (PdmS protein) n=1 Tax=Coniochaeta hoffmannii TaxID=91930 RepID=A0AA38VQ53_9PEZI|nr:Glycosyl transferase (PdmS protein) [Coniochaeta hoffmannii]